MAECFHRQLKVAIRCHNRHWTEASPVVLLGIRTAWKGDLGAAVAEMVYDQPLRLPGEFFNLEFNNEQVYMPNFANELRLRFQMLRALNGS